APLDAACRRGALSIELPDEIRHSYRKARLEARIANRSDCTWPAFGVGKDGLVMLDYEWLEDGAVVVRGTPGRLTRDLPPGATADEPLHVLTPRGGREYRLRVALRQQGIESPLATWEG